MKAALAGNVLVAVLLGVFLASAAPRLKSEGRDIGSLMLGTPDEFEIAKGLYGMFVDRTLDYKVPAYPGAYPMLSYLVAKPILKLVGFGERNLILLLRWLSAIFGAATLLLLYVATRAVGGSPWAGLLAAGFLASSPEYLFWSVRIHPDTMVLFELVFAQLALALAVHRRSQRWLTVALVMMALGAMTKIVGIFLLPWVVLAQAYLDFSEDSPTRVRLRSFVLHVFWGGLIFLVIAYVTTPMLLVDSRAFLASMKTTSTLTSTGWQRFAAIGWLEVFWGDKLAGAVGTVLFGLWAVSFVPALVRILRAPRDRLKDFGAAALRPLPFLFFAAGFIGYLIVFSKNFQVRYAMPALPSAAVGIGLMAAGAFPHLERLSSWIASKPGWTRVVATALAIGLFIPELKSRKWHLDGDLESLSARGQDPRLAVGEWLAENAPANARVIFDYHVYVPIKFEKAFVTWGLLESQVTNIDPHFVLIQDDRRALFSKEEDAEGDEEARWYHKNRVQTLRRLEQGELPGLRLAKRFDAAKITVYSSSTALSCSGVCSLKP